MQGAAEVLVRFEIPHEVRVVSAHRTPEDMVAFGRGRGERRSAGHRRRRRGGGAPARDAGGPHDAPGDRRAVALAHLDGLDSLLSIVQMPRGVAVATVAVDGTYRRPLAARILFLADPSLAAASRRLRLELAGGAVAQNAELGPEPSPQRAEGHHGSRRKPRPPPRPADLPSGPTGPGAGRSGRAAPGHGGSERQLGPSVSVRPRRGRVLSERADRAPSRDPGPGVREDSTSGSAPSRSPGRIAARPSGAGTSFTTDPDDSSPARTSSSTRTLPSPWLVHREDRDRTNTKASTRTEPTSTVQPFPSRSRRQGRPRCRVHEPAPPGAGGAASGHPRHRPPARRWVRRACPGGHRPSGATVSWLAGPRQRARGQRRAPEDRAGFGGAGAGTDPVG